MSFREKLPDFFQRALTAFSGGPPWFLTAFDH
jgi:hypothetical protein